MVHAWLLQVSSRLEFFVLLKLPNLWEDCAIIYRNEHIGRWPSTRSLVIKYHLP